MSGKQFTVVLNCYVAKALLVKYQITAHPPCMDIHVAKTRFVTLLSAKMLVRAATSALSINKVTVSSAS